MEAPGNVLLKVTSVFFVIYGVATVLLSLIALLFSTLVASLGGAIALTAGGVLFVASVIILVTSVLGLISAILGLKKSNDPSQANFFIVNGCVLCTLMLLSLFLGFQVIGLIGFVLPALYIAGGLMNKRAAANGNKNSRR